MHGVPKLLFQTQRIGRTQSPAHRRVWCHTSLDRAARSMYLAEPGCRSSVVPWEPGLEHAHAATACCQPAADRNWLLAVQGELAVGSAVTWMARHANSALLAVACDDLSIRMFDVEVGIQAMSLRAA